MGVFRWHDLTPSQAGVFTHAQLRAAGVDIWAIEHRIASGRWSRLAPTVVRTTTGPLSREQLLWLAVLHGGTGAALAGLTAAGLAGLRNWDRETVTVMVPYLSEVPPPLPGVTFVRTRRDLPAMISPASGVPRLRVEPAILLFASADRSPRTAQGVLAAAVQQRLTTPEELMRWLGRLRPLPKAPILRAALLEMAGGAHSLAEIDVRRMCAVARLVPPRRQVRRRDSQGRLRYTDCEWLLADGRVLVLEVDGLFHMSVESWEDDLARQRALSGGDRIIVRCTAREIRDEPDVVARDLLALGVPRADAV